MRMSETEEQDGRLRICVFGVGRWSCSLPPRSGQRSISDKFRNFAWRHSAMGTCSVEIGLTNSIGTWWLRG